MRTSIAILLGFLVLAAPGAAAQAPPPLPARVSAEVEIAGTPVRWANVTLDLGGRVPWRMTGCIADLPGVCAASVTIDLTEAERREIVADLSSLSAMPLCEPEVFAPGDPQYTVHTTTASFRGHLPREPSVRLEGPCDAPRRLARWLRARIQAAAGAPTHH